MSSIEFPVSFIYRGAEVRAHFVSAMGDVQLVYEERESGNRYFLVWLGSPSRGSVLTYQPKANKIGDTIYLKSLKKALTMLQGYHETLYEGADEIVFEPLDESI